MRFHSALSDEEVTHDAVEQVIAETSAAMNEKVDVVFAFFTGHHLEEAEDLLERLWLELDPQALIGCSAEGVIAADREIERSPAIAILAAQLPDVRVHPFHVAGESDWRSILSDSEQLKERLGLGPQTRALIGLGDPFSTPLDQFIDSLEHAAPQLPLIGGMASSARQPGQNVLLRNDQSFTDGLVGLSISGPIAVETIVSQGCRPIGTPLVITRSHQNVIEQLGGKPALAALQELVESISEEQRQSLENGLLVGRAISEYRERFGRGDFLIRNIVGVEQEKGWLAIADFVKTGQTVQFHVRDAQTADEDLGLMLEAQHLAAPPAGALLFSCNGRGTNLFQGPCHDVGAVRQAVPQLPVAGFFAAGELGPIRGKNFIHGHTASLALFRPEK